MTQTVLSGPWSAGEIGTYLAGAVIPVRLSAISPAGWPVVLSLWFLYEDGAFHCASRSHARIVALLDANPRCGFEVAGETPPYCGVRGQGLATLDRTNGAAVLARLADRYLGTGDTPFRRKLMQGAQDEVALVIRPTRMMSWDYRKRMK
ncbi:MAG: pyridoxamine 5'-phosphate oxidase family protein [Proteobacteria bacterium]|nr:pyridoxamine 5'-phosphate oxidase family protein [Pseudomonadota bacterium]